MKIVFRKENENLSMKGAFEGCRQDLCANLFAGSG